MHFTKNDSWNNRRFYQVMEQNNRVIRQAKNHYMQQLEEKARELTKHHQEELEKFQE